jgi:uncharacterized membrane protein
MNLSTQIKRWAVTFGIFMAVDLVWLGFIAQPIYEHFIGDFLDDTPNWYGAVAFYILFIVGMLYFAINPALKEKSMNLAVKNGALYGFFTYMTYELTNYAVINGWPLGIVFVDIAWGIVLGTSVSSISYKILAKK